jgi:hypothetical protein
MLDSLPVLAPPYGSPASLVHRVTFVLELASAQSIADRTAPRSSRQRPIGRLSELDEPTRENGKERARLWKFLIKSSSALMLRPNFAMAEWRCIQNDPLADRPWAALAGVTLARERGRTAPAGAGGWLPGFFACSCLFSARALVSCSARPIRAEPLWR